MSERRNEPRPGARERRSFPRPPLWLNLLLLIIAAATFAYAKHQRDVVEEKTALLFRKSESSPEDLNRMRDELAQMDLTKQQLGKELDGRVQYLQTLQSEQFYISIDTTKKKFQFRLGKEVIREADVQLGGAKTLTSKDGKTWTFYPLKGGFSVTGKQSDYSIPVAEWVYALHGEPIPQQRPTVKNWLGRYVIYLPDGYVIHSPPPKDSPVQGPKPGSFMVPEDDLAAIWPRISTQTRVYIF
jgi:hypothetical protein